MYSIGAGGVVVPAEMRRQVDVTLSGLAPGA